MASLTITAPDTLVPRLVAAVQYRYPDLTGTAAATLKAGIRRLLAETLADAESHATQTAKLDEANTATAAARTQALTDAADIT